MGHPHVSRREILRSIPVLAGGTLLRPLEAQKPDTSAPAVIKGKLLDGATGQPIAAKIRVTLSGSGQAFFPEGAIRTKPAPHYFYARGGYEIAVPPGRYQIQAVRGICHEAAVDFTEVGSGVTHVHDFRVPVLWDVRQQGWYSGNTHTHYHLQIDEDPDDRLRMVPPAEALDVSVISYLIRNDSPYITNRYPIGRLPQFSRDGTIMDMGEEARNNRTFGEFGYGHCLFLNIPRAIEPVSTGLLSKDAKTPDFPTLSMLCAEAQKTGGTTVWCHNGGGMEMPVAAALGNLNAYNLADGLDANYGRYYQLLNCGFRVPASSGTDWWIYDHNRVFVKVNGAFTYDSWIEGLRAGRTFVTNGPLIDFTVNGQGPGAMLEIPRGMGKVRARVLSRMPFERIEIVQDGEVIAEQSAVNGREVVLEREVELTRGGWMAARVVSSAKSWGGTTVFAHTSPVYYRVAGTPHRRAGAAGAFIDEIEEAMAFIRAKYKFSSEADKAIAIGRFVQAREAYARISRG
ncbi:MAG: CehA/McbA family metallohydrolase [Acidobacteria bacterium]|nr:CehA/McbA family metallohydrolase [Acidobacteriota bacterium]